MHWFCVEIKDREPYYTWADDGKQARANALAQFPGCVVLDVWLAAEQSEMDCQ